MSSDERKYLRLSQIIPHILPISKTQFYAGIAAGRFPPPFKAGPRTSLWVASDIYDAIDKLEKQKSERTSPIKATDLKTES